MPGERDELFSVRVAAGSRTYFFDVKQSRDGDRYLVISESRPSGDRYEHGRVMVFDEHLTHFAEGFVKAFARLRDAARSNRSSSMHVGTSDVGIPTETAAAPPTKSYDVADVRRTHPNAYASWTPQDDDRLQLRFAEGADIATLAAELGRKPGAIESRLRKLALDCLRRKPDKVTPDRGPH